MKVKVEYKVIKEIEVEVDDKFLKTIDYEDDEEETAYTLTQELLKSTNKKVEEKERDCIDCEVIGLYTTDNYSIWED